MKQGWEIKRLGDICDLQNGFAFKSNDYIDFSNTMNFRMSQIRPGGGIDLENNPKFLPDDYAVKYKDYLLKEGDVVIAMTDLATETKILGVPTIVPKDNRNWLLNQRVGKLSKIDFSKVDVAFLKYILTSETINEYYKSLGRGGLQINIGKQDILNAKIPLPPLPEQQRIVSILDEAFAAIAKAKANAEQNLRNATELFERYLQGVFENKGDGWKEKSLGEICEISSKLIDPKKAEFQNLIHIGAGNIESQKGTLIDLKTAKEENLISGKFLFDESMVLYSKIRPYLMKVVKCEFKGLCSADIYPLVPFKNELTRDFLYYLLLTQNFTDYAILGSQRAGMPKVNREHLFAYNLHVPSIEVQKTIVQKLDALSAETKKLEAIYQQKINDLEEMKKSILEKAFNGELKTS